MIKFKTINGIDYPIGDNYLKPQRETCYKYKDGKYYLYYGKYIEGKSKKRGLYNRDGKIYLHIPEIKKKTENNISGIDMTALTADILKNKSLAINNIKQSKEIISEEDKKNTFEPPIQENNDILVRIIKETLSKLKIPEKILKQRFTSDSEWNNYKRALLIRDSITIQGFAKWMSILNVKWKIDTFTN